MVGEGREGDDLSHGTMGRRMGEKAQVPLEGGAWPACRSRAWQAPLSSESSKAAKGRVPATRGRAKSPQSRLTNYWT